MPKPLGYIYLITNGMNDKKYVGQTRNCKARWREHRRITPWCVSEILEHGDVFDYEIIDRASTQEALTSLERHYILKYRALEPEFGYNNSWPGAYEQRVKGRKLGERESTRIKRLAKRRARKYLRDKSGTRASVIAQEMDRLADKLDKLKLEAREHWIASLIKKFERGVTT